MDGDADLAEELAAGSGIFGPRDAGGPVLSEEFEELLCHNIGAGDPPGRALAAAVRGFMPGGDEKARLTVTLYVAAMLWRAHPDEYGSILEELGARYLGPWTAMPPRGAGGSLADEEIHWAYRAAVRGGILIPDYDNTTRVSLRFLNRVTSYVDGGCTPAEGMMAAIDDLLPGWHGRELSLVAGYVGAVLAGLVPDSYGSIPGDLIASGLGY